MSGAAAVFMSGSAAVALAFSGTASGYSNTGTTVNITTGSVTVTPSGGVSPYTYAWTQYGTSPYTWTIGSPSTASTSFTCTSVPAGAVTSVQFLVTVTDAAGNHAHGIVTASVNNGQPYDSSTGGASGGGGRGTQIP